jgi:arylsulfatase A-like enzyme
MLSVCSFAILADLSAWAGTITFELNGNGDPTGGAGASHPEWSTSGSSLQKTTNPLNAAYDVDFEGDGTNDVSIVLSSPTPGAAHLMLSGAAAKGITLDGNGSGGINADEVMRISFGSDVIINGFLLVAFSGESADYVANGITNTTTSASVSGLSIALAAGEAFDIQLTHPAGGDAFRLKNIDLTVTGAPPPPPPASSTTWTGATNSTLTEVGNWSDGLPDNTLPGLVSGTANVTYATADALNLKTLIFEGSSSLSGAAINWADGTNTLENTASWMASGTVVMGSSIAPALLTLNHAAQFNGTDLQVGASEAGVVDQNGGTVVLSGQLSLANSGSGYLLDSGSIDVGDLLLSSGNGNIDFESSDSEGSVSVATNGGAFVAAGGFESYITNGLITLAGSAATLEDFEITTVSGKVTLAVAPPPLIQVSAEIPNIIIFLADDMGQGDTSAYQDWTGIPDASQVYTPAMELLAERGIRFMDGHAASGVCQPSRQALTRGGRPESNHENFGAHALPKMLKKAGFMTYGIGKWHIHYQNAPGDPMDADLGSDYHYNSPATWGPLDYGYDHYTGTENNITKSPAFIIDRHYMKYDTSTNGLAALVPNLSTSPPGYGSADGPREEKCQQIWVDAAREYMADHAVGGSRTNQPFFLYYASHANHKNYYAAPEIDGIAITGNCRVATGQTLSISEFGLEKITGAGGGSTYLNNGLILERSEMVWENDVALARLIHWLENADDPRHPGQKMIDNTLLIFAADNGANIDRYPEDSNNPTAADQMFPHPNHGVLRGRKGDIWEGGNRIPFIASWPGKIPTNTTSAAQISLLDLYATFAATAGVALEADEALHSFNMLDAMLDPALTDSRSQGVYASNKINRDINMLRDGGYKIVWNGKGIPGPGDFDQLYNLDDDLSEATNLLGNATYSDIETSLRSQATTLASTGRARPTVTPENWLADNTTLVGADAAWLADGDGDGHYNLEEYAFGSAPDSAADLPDGFNIWPESTNGLPVVHYKRRLDHAAMGLEYAVEQTGDLVGSSWTPDGVIEIGSPVPSGDGQTEWVSVGYTNAASSNTFMRVRVSTP